MASEHRASPRRPAPARAERAHFIGLDFDLLEPGEADAWIGARSAQSPFAYVVTPNVDHLVRLETAGDAIRATYAQADLCLCDSRVLARLALLCGLRLPVVTGSDLVARLLGSVLVEGDCVVVIGSSAEAIAALTLRFPHLRFVHHMPPMGLRHDAVARAQAGDKAVAAQARIILLAVGSPQQELIAAELKGTGRAHGTALCIGASIDFLTGAQQRAPRIVQRAGFEWAWRLATSPRRLFRRYLVEGPAIFAIVWKWRRRQRGR
jgi:exopolysaccharide biosynthesis WecB/TagA/CpsF family protein